MKIQCDYCDNTYEDTLYNCPHCGARNPSHNDGDVRPKTIEELEKWYKDHNLPPYETTRFFIGINYKNPKAFGIYKEDNKFIVYKNKADGSRAIRYEGEDEQYAVHELWQRLKDEIINQKNNQNKTSSIHNKTDAKSLKFTLMSIFIPFIIPITCAISVILCYTFNTTRTGYFISDNNETYYHESYYDNWYYYDSDTSDWSEISHSDLPSELKDTKTAEDYYVSSTWNSNYSSVNWEDTTYYDEYQTRYEADSESSSSSDSYSWDSSDSWDSGSTDWDSDW